MHRAPPAKTLETRTTVRHVTCPHCGAQAEWSTRNPYRPFCSERCKTIDLGAWASEQYRLPAEEDDETPDDDADAMRAG